MKANEENLKKLKVYAILTNTLDEYVYLREDEKGRYIEYSFIEGSPHDSRCLSWYVKPHPKYDRKHNGTPKVWANVGEIYRLREFACGNQNKEGVERCCAGHPKESCDYITVGRKAGEKWRDWSYEEPIKCACWDLDEIDDIEQVSIPIDIAIELFDTFEVKEVDVQKERMSECPYRQVGCTMYEGKILECKGACSWVVDYPRLKELKAQKGE